MRFASLVPGRERRLAALILMVAVAVRLWDIRARSLWFDEAGEFWVATASFSQLFASARTGTGDPPLYTFLLHLWMQTGTSELWLRLLSLLGSVAGVAGVMVLARRLAGPAAALFAGGLMALLPIDVRYAQEVGQYGMVSAAVAWNLVFLRQMSQERTWRAVLGWTATALAASYLYYGAVFPIAGCFLAVVFESVARRDLRTRRATGTALVLYLAGMIPLFISYLPTQLARVVEAGGVQTPLPETGGGVLGFLHTKWTLASALLAFQFTGWPHTQIPAAIVIVPVTALVVWGAPRAPRLAAWLVASLVVYTAAYVAGLFPMGYRWGLILTPLIICATAAGLNRGLRTRAKWATIAVFAGLIAVCAISLPNRSWYDRVHPHNTGTWPETEDMRAVVDYWMRNRAPGQKTYVYYGAAPAFGYYTRDLVPREELPPTWCFACWHDPSPPAFCSEQTVYYGRWMRRLNDPEKIDSVIETLGGAPETLWLVFAHIAPDDDARLIAGFIRRGYRLDAVGQAQNASTCLLVRNR